MSWNVTSRRTHRWVSVVFALTVLVNVVSAVLGGPEWVGLVAVPPILVLLATGLHLFAMPYLVGRRAVRRPSGPAR